MEVTRQHTHQLITGYTPTDPSGLCIGPVSCDKASVLVFLKSR